MSPLHAADLSEFTKICKAVGMGFIIMGVVGYVVKLGMCASSPLLPTRWMRSIHRRRRVLSTKY